MMHRLSTLLLLLLLLTLPSLWLTSGLVAQSRVKLKPLPEMQACEDYETLSSDRRLVYKESKTEKAKSGRPKQTMLSYSEHKVLKAMLDGKRIYVHKFWKEAPLLKIGYFEIRSSIEVYNEKMELIALRRMKQSKGDPEYQEIRWKEGQLFLKSGRKKEKPLASQARPEFLFGLMLLGKMKSKEKRIVHVLTGLVTEEVELTMIGINRSEEGPMVNYSCTGTFAGQWWVSTQGKGLMRARLKTPEVVIDQPRMSREDCGLMLDRAKVCASRFIKQALKASTGKKRKWKNRFVGMSLRLPAKDWKQKGKLGDSRIFTAMSKNQFASLEVFAWHTSYTTGAKGLIAARMRTDKSKAKRDSIRREDIELAGREGVRFEYDWENRGRNRHETIFFFTGKGCALEIKFGVWDGARKSFKSDLRAILKSVKFDK